MKDTNISDIPEMYAALEAKAKEIGFTMSSDLYIGTLLKTLVTSKPKANLLELGTGIGLSLSWMIAGMDSASKLTTLDNDPKLTAIAKEYFGHDQRVQIVCEDGTSWINNYRGEPFDLIFADAWPGKYSDLAAVLTMLKVGGFYVIDDMSVQPNWPEGHQEKVNQLIEDLEQRKDLHLTKMNWSTGVIIAVKKC